MKTTWHTPAGRVYALYEDMLQQPHLLVAGATGSGKSVVINGIMATALYSSPARAQFILIDPKRVELLKYRKLPHVIMTATEPDQWTAALNTAINIMEKRYKAMAKTDATMYTGADVYVIIDELMDMMTRAKKAVEPLILRLTALGRAARVHVIMATQSPIREVISTPIKCNVDARVGLRTSCAQDSRNILGVNGCERLPEYGQGIFRTSKGSTLYNIPMIPKAEITRLCNHWTSRKSYTRSLF